MLLRTEICVVFCLLGSVSLSLTDLLNLPSEHLHIVNNMLESTYDSSGGAAEHLDRQQYSNLTCNGDFIGWAETRREAERVFFNQADFGYVSERKAEIVALCSNDNELSSSLKCSSHLQYCEAQLMMIDLTKITHRARNENLRYKMDVLEEGDVHLDCLLDEAKWRAELDFLSPLQSWAPELRNIRKSVGPISKDSSNCDLYIDKPVYVVKLDAISNMYHHFCDFFNLYVSLLLRPPEDGRPPFDTDNQVIIWENIKYQSKFGQAWNAFTKNPLLNLQDLAGKRVCLKSAVFPLLPRMVYGLYYNTPLITGCQDSGLFKAFSQFILHRLDIRQQEPDNKLRVTFLSRKTRYRRVLNEEELVQALQNTGRMFARIVSFDDSISFHNQLKIVRNTDILIGMHGAGLTHLMFLPDWAGVFELYHCQDPACYSDLARLRGLKYITWEDESLLEPVESAGTPYSGPAHHKFRNYKFDTGEFVRLVEKLEQMVTNDEHYPSRQKHQHQQNTRKHSQQFVKDRGHDEL